VTNWFVNHRGRKWKEKQGKQKKFANQVKSKLRIESVNNQIQEQQRNALVEQSEENKKQISKIRKEEEKGEQKRSENGKVGEDQQARNQQMRSFVAPQGQLIGQANSQGPLYYPMNMMFNPFLYIPAYQSNSHQMMLNQNANKPNQK
jgi:hypothetical protein